MTGLWEEAKNPEPEGIAYVCRYTLLRSPVMEHKELYDLFGVIYSYLTITTLHLYNINAVFNFGYPLSLKDCKYLKRRFILYLFFIK